MYESTNGNKGLILVVDDDEGTRLALEMALSDDGYEVQTANDGQHALEVLDGCSPHAILLDIRMPVMDGSAFLTAYRNRPPPHAAVIAMTTSRTPQHPIPEDVEDILLKPYDLDDLFAMLERHLPKANSGIKA